ncbi:MAG: TonB-dependent receptor, partial [Candidatus Sulfotelmatobacter sp.]
FHLSIAGPQENVTVSGSPKLVDTNPSAVSTLIDERAIADLPLNGRRFSDLMLLSPGVTQDPRSLTSSTNGDLSFGGLRGFQNSFLVDGGDFNNAFYAQARGLYRTPYQFSNEVVQEFRVSTNSYGAELGRAGGAVVNVVTKSGSNHWHGTDLYYIRDSGFGAADPMMSFKPHSRQQQGGGTIGGPIKKNKVFFFGGFDQHYFHVPDVVEFLDGTMQVVPQAGTGPYSPGDYEASDQALVFAAAAKLTSYAGSFPAAQIGNAAYAKLDINLTPRNQLALRYNSSRYWGSNNVFLDPASPVTYDSISDNGEEIVSTDTGSASLTSGLTSRFISHLRAQFSRDLRQSYTNTNDTLIKVTDIMDGIGRSDLLPRSTREHRAQLAETLSLDTSRHSFKFGGDSLITWIYDFFPSQQSGEYLFDEIKVNPFTFAPEEGGLPLTPLRAYAHAVPHYYLQNFGQAASNPNSNDYAAFAQDTIRVTDHLAVNLGVRWDLQTFTTAGLESNPLFPPSGKVPYKPLNFGPRAGLAYSIGKNHPLVIRAGYGIFYVRIPQIYNSAIATENGINDAQVFLNNNIYADRQAFPTYPNPLVTCSLSSANCNLPQGFTEGVTNDVSAFAPNFVTPRVQQASLTLEREVADHTTVAVSYLYVHANISSALSTSTSRNRSRSLIRSSIPRARYFRTAITPLIPSPRGNTPSRRPAHFPLALILSDVPSPNWARSTNSRAPPPASTTAQRFPSTAAWLAGLIFASPIPTPMPSTTVKTPWLRANPRPCRIPINPMPSVAPASPTSATDSLPPSPPSRASSIAATNFSAMFSTTGKFPASSPPAAGVP